MNLVGYGGDEDVFNESTVLMTGTTGLVDSNLITRLAAQRSNHSDHTTSKTTGDCCRATSGKSLAGTWSVGLLEQPQADNASTQGTELDGTKEEYVLVEQLVA